MRCNPFLGRQGIRKAALALAAGFFAWLLPSVASAAMLDPGAFLVTTNTNHVVRYSLSGVQQQDLLLTGLLPGINVVASGPAVLNGRLFVGFAVVSGPGSPYIGEVNPTTGALINTFSAGVSHLNRLGEDGTNLLALDSVSLNPFKVSELSVSGASVGTVFLTPYATGFQSAGIAGDGTSIFTPLQSSGQPIVTNNYAGAIVSQFNTNLNQASPIRGLAYNHVDHTIWMHWSNFGNGNPAQFRHYDLNGNLLGTVLAPDLTTGIEILPVPEPGSLVLLAIGGLGLLYAARRRGRSDSKTPARMPTDQAAHGNPGDSIVCASLASLALVLALTPLASATVISGPIVNPGNGHSYYLLAAEPWSAAETESMGLGGHLATINDAAENTWVTGQFSNFGGSPHSLWIGLNDVTTEGQFAWTSGEAVGYTNWAPGEPNNSNGGEDFAVIFAPDNSLFPQWNDINLSGSTLGVAEVVPEPSTLLLGGIGLAAVVCVARAKARRAAERGKSFNLASRSYGRGQGVAR
jgi:hypothetical protein